MHQYTRGERCDATVTIVSDDVVDLYSAESAHLVHRFHPNHIHDQVPLANTLQRLTSSDNKLSMISREINYHHDQSMLEGRPTCARWCEETGQMVVGFSNGGVGLLSAPPSPNSPTIRIKTNAVHNCAVTLLLTYRISAHSRAQEDKVGLLVGDSSGWLSAWVLSPRCVNWIYSVTPLFHRSLSLSVSLRVAPFYDSLQKSYHLPMEISSAPVPASQC